MIKQFIVLSVLLFCATFAYTAEQDILDKVESSARSWLALTDEGLYTKGWKKASSHFQKKWPESDWVKAIDAIKKPLGSMEARYIASAGYSQGLSGFPKGEYVVVQFYTTFKHKGLAMETITLAKEKDNSWRVADYVIK
ncbi:DUF4019 domain-containing protein [Nitrosomonas aestuarii]|uniref:DUF4019 domain-containing protein n=1 Tax=Nitrosomonas aestuarii TaxID=52441 RepID=UPI000D30EC84|nr:DUF4019 domain-containing protein [Nitrosomonas aestuarii]PTN12320.1 uncharacterized protein DUF4019 [Nitrosomonas aestuarii]